METEKIRYIYCITNKVNGHTYFGQRTLAKGRTFETDTYRGSGKILWQAYEKYGKENFERSCIIQGNFTKEQINRFEKCIIRIQRLLGKAEYNIADGGEGGNVFWRNATSEDKKAQSERSKMQWIEHKDAYIEGRKKASETIKRRVKSGEICYAGEHNGMFGKRHSDEAKRKMSERKFKNNGSSGTHWFTDGKTNVKAKECPEGFHRGRI